MRNKNLGVNIVFSLLITASFFILACENPLIQEIWDLRTITFDSMGGSSVPSQTLLKGYPVKKPDNPSKESYAFTGWYREEAALTAWNFNSVPDKSLTLYAGWESPGLELSPSGSYIFPNLTEGYSASDLTSCLITFTNISKYMFNEVTVHSDSSSFNISQSVFNNEYEPGDSDTFTVTPVTGLEYGTHTAVITVAVPASAVPNASSGYSVSIKVSFTVTKPQGDINITLEIDPITEKANILGTGFIYDAGGYYYKTPPIILSGTAKDEATISVTLSAGVTNPRWEVQGAGMYAGQIINVADSSDPASCTIKADLDDPDHVKYCVPGYHFVRLYVTADGKEYQVNIRFEIQ